MYETLINRESADEILQKLDDATELEKAEELKKQQEKIEEEKNIPDWQKILF